MYSTVQCLNFNNFCMKSHKCYIVDVYTLPLQTPTVDLYEQLSALEPSDLDSFTQQIASGMVCMLVNHLH